MKLTFPITIFLAMCLIFTYGFWLGTKNPETEVYDSNQMIEQALVQRFPTVKQLQTELVRRGEDIGPKGIDGKMDDCDTYRAMKRVEELQYNQDICDEVWPKGE